MGPGLPLQYLKNISILPKTGLPSISIILISCISTNCQLNTQHQTHMSGTESLPFFYKSLDDEHIVLFDNLRAVEEDPKDEFLVGKMKHSMKEHFSHEEVEICDAPEIDWDYCMDHKRKHTHFTDRLNKIHAPADIKEIKAAQAWLAQHIKNTDFAYRGKLKHETPSPC